MYNNYYLRVTQISIMILWSMNGNERSETIRHARV